MNTDNTVKLKALSMTMADAAADIGLINQYSLKALRPEDVFCFNAVLTNNEVDRDKEYVTDDSLNVLAEKLLGKTGILDHDWSAENQVARIYRTLVEQPGGTNFQGRPLKQLKGSVYILRNADTQPIIDKVEGGIIKEISIGFQSRKYVCSVCGEPLGFDYNDWTYKCKNGHVKGQEYDGRICAGGLDDVTDAYEFSFVAVPANTGAGVTKGLDAPTSAHEAIMKMSLEQLAGMSEANDAVIKHLQMAQTAAEELDHRKSIREYAENL